MLELLKQNNLYSKLLSELIGLIRAIDSNEHMISNTTNIIIIEALKVDINDSNMLNNIINKIDIEKRKIIPDCYKCMHPCGKSDSLNIEELFNENIKIFNLKNDILKLLISINIDKLNNILESPYNIIYKALYYIGIINIDFDLLSNLYNEILKI